MDQRTVPKTVQYNLKLPPEQAWELGRVLGLRRTLYHTAVERRIVAYQRRHVCVSRYQQQAELNAVRAEMPAYATIHSPVPHDVLARLDKTSRALLRRLKAGEQAGFPRYQSRDQWHSFTSQVFGASATLDTGFLVLSKLTVFVTARCG